MTRAPGSGASAGVCRCTTRSATNDSCVFTPLIPAQDWAGAIRVGEALASAAHPDQANAANEFWDKEAASMLAPLLHAAALANAAITELVRWLDARDFSEPIAVLKGRGAEAAADQLEGVQRRDERNRETTVMSALNLLRAYRYPELAGTSREELAPQEFLDGAANTIYVVAAGHDQELLRPVILALLAAIYETAIARARLSGPIEPRLFILMDEAANIAPVRNLASWLSQCGDHGIVIATIWQSIAQIDQRYGRAARDAICAASTAQLFIPPLADPTSASYLTELSARSQSLTAQRSSGLIDHPPQGRARALAQTDRAWPRDPDLPGPPARRRARTRVVRGSALHGPPTRRKRQATRHREPPAQVMAACRR